jgi:hypothetical protein
MSYKISVGADVLYKMYKLYYISLYRRYNILENKVLSKVVHFDVEDNICMCDKEFFKTCLVRERNDLICRECIVKISPLIEKVLHDDNENIFSGPRPFQDTLEHLGRLG